MVCVSAISKELCKLQSDQTDHRNLRVVCVLQLIIGTKYRFDDVYTCVQWPLHSHCIITLLKLASIKGLCLMCKCSCLWHMMLQTPNLCNAWTCQSLWVVMMWQSLAIAFLHTIVLANYICWTLCLVALASKAYSFAGSFQYSPHMYAYASICTAVSIMAGCCLYCHTIPRCISNSQKCACPAVPIITDSTALALISQTGLMVNSWSEPHRWCAQTSHAWA